MSGQPSIREFLRNNDRMESANGLFYEKNLNRNQAFESHYTRLRKLEGRLYDDPVVRGLPEFVPGHTLSREWAIRRRSAARLADHLKRRSTKSLLELGCGNGWLTHFLHNNTNTDCCGMDVNETELKQAARLFGGETLNFLFARDVSVIEKKIRFDAIILASSIQYFSDPVNLLLQLREMLSSHGQIHILDSPLYEEKEVDSARFRSEKYFNAMGEPEMTSHYFHHPWSTLDNFRFSVLHNPKSFRNRLAVKLSNESPFPWVVVEPTAGTKP